MDEDLPKMDPIWEEQPTQPQVDAPPPMQVIVQPAQPEAATSATDQTQSQNPSSPPQTQFIQGQMQPMNMGMGAGMGAAPQQVVYIPLKYKPRPTIVPFPTSCLPSVSSALFLEIFWPK